MARSDVTGAVDFGGGRRAGRRVKSRAQAKLGRGGVVLVNEERKAELKAWKIAW